MIIHSVNPPGAAPGASARANIATCVFGHRAHSGSCAGCQRVLALRHAAQLNAASVANTRWKARLH